MCLGTLFGVIVRIRNIIVVLYVVLTSVRCAHTSRKCPRCPRAAQAPPLPPYPPHTLPAAWTGRPSCCCCAAALNRRRTSTCTFHVPIAFNVDSGGTQAALASLHPKPLRGEQATLRCPWSSINSQACPLWAGRGGQAWRAPSSPSWPTDSCQQAGARHSCRHASRARPPAPPGRGRSRRDRDGCVARRGQTRRLARR